MTFKDVLGTAGAFAVLAAVARLLNNLYVRHIDRAFVWMSRDASWMTPLGFLIVFVVIAVAVAIVALVVPSIRRPGPLTVIFGTAAGWSMLLNFPKVLPAASLVLAVGVAYQLSRFLERADHGLRRFRAVGLALTVPMALAGGVERGWRTWSEHRAPSGRSLDVRAPNVLLIVLDTVRASSTSLYGSAEPTTPFLERLARESIVFDRAISPSSWTLPSHASLFTGVRPLQLGLIPGSGLPPGRPTLAERFDRRGYATAAFSANLMYASYESGLMRGFRRVVDYKVSLTEILWHSNLAQALLHYEAPLRARDPVEFWRRATLTQFRVPPEPAHDWPTASNTVDRFLAWHDSLDRQPYFAFLNFIDAHHLDPPADAVANIRPESTATRKYLRSIAFIDRQLDRLVSALRSRGDLDRTVLVVTADHGEQFGEHGTTGHGNSMYMQLLHVPLMIRYPPRIHGGARLTAPVSLTDLASTLAALSGDAAIQFSGRTIPLDTETALRDANVVIAETPETNWRGAGRVGPMVSVVDDSRHYIRRDNDIEELYDYRNDPGDATDLSKTDAGREAIARLRERLTAKD